MLLPLAAGALLLRYVWPAPAPASPRARVSEPTARVDDKTQRIRGKVVDVDGRPVRSATVRVVVPKSPFTVLREATSDGNGAFSFAELDPGRVLLVADHYPEGFGTGEEVEVTPDKSEEVTLVLSATSGVRGTVVDGSERPVSGAMLAVSGVPWRLPNATTDTAGAFRMIVVPDQATAIVASAQGFKSATVVLEHREPRTELVVRVRLSPGSPVQGDVRSAEGEPVRGARIVACAGQSASEVAATSDADGSFELPPSAIGCNAFAQMTGFAATEPTPVVEGSPLHLRLRAGGGIEGVVVDERGTGVPAFSIGIESFMAEKSVTSFGSFMQPRYDRGPRTFEDPRGSFLWDKLMPGDYVLTASVKGKPLVRSATLSVQSGAVTRGVRIVMAAGGSVVGHIVDDHDNAVADVDLAFDSVSSIVESSVYARSDASGNYRLDGAPAGPFSVKARKRGFVLHVASGLRVASGATLREDMKLTPDDGKGGVDLAGVGANLVASPEGIVVSGVRPDDPAARAGIQPGDRIVSIDGESTEGMSVTDAIQRLRGKAGTNVGVSVERPITRQIVDVVVVRAAIAR